MIGNAKKVERLLKIRVLIRRLEAEARQVCNAHDWRRPLDYVSEIDGEPYLQSSQVFLPPGYDDFAGLRRRHEELTGERVVI